MEENAIIKELDQSIQEYYKYDKSEKDAKKFKKPLNEQIKSFMKEIKSSVYTAGNVKAIFKTQERTKLNEDKLLAKLNDLGRSDCIVMKPTVDVDKVEDLIYKGELDGKILSDCIEVKHVETLTVKEVK